LTNQPAKYRPMVMSEAKYPLLAVSRLRMDGDGEGVTTLIAGKGCPLSCKYCINKEALTMHSMDVTAQELFDRVKCDDLYFQATGGGVTFGGGESLLHAAFIREFRTLCKHFWHIYAETSLYVPEKNVRIASECVDGFIVDIKDMDPGIYKAYTGADNAQVLENLKLLLELVGPEHILVRAPLIAHFNTEEDQKKSVQLLTGMGFTRFDRFSYVIRD